MKRSFLFQLLFLMLTTIAFAQPGKNLVPTTTHAKVILVLKNLDKAPIPHANIKVASANEGGVAYEGKTDNAGNWECLLPMNQSYQLSVGDSVNYNQFTVSNRPGLVMRHTTYFEGFLNGKYIGSSKPGFNMMPPQDGLANITVDFKGLQNQPLPHEKVTLTADGSKKVYIDSTDYNGRIVMKVPIKESYTLALPYHATFQHFEFPAHAGSYTVRLTYVYAGKAEIERMRTERLARQQEYDAYQGLSHAQQIKERDSLGHKREFRTSPITRIPSPFTVQSTSYGYALHVASPSPVASPYYINGWIVAGAGWDSGNLAAVDAQTGTPKWSVKLDESGISTLSGDDDDVVVCATESCTIYAIAARTGTLLWSKWLATYVLSAPCVSDGRLYIGYEDENGSSTIGGAAAGKPYVMACFDLKTGNTIWQRWIAGEVMSSAVADGGKLYFNTFSGYTYVLNQKDGDLIAEKRLFATSAPTIVAGQVCMAQRDGDNQVARERIAAFDGKTLELLRATPYQDAPYLDLVSNEKTQYASAADNISLNTGSLGLPIAKAEKIGPEELVGTKSVYAVASFEGSRPLELSGKLFVTQGHVLRALDAKSLVQAWEWQYPTSLTDDGGANMAPPIAVNGKVVVACMDGAIREFDPATGRITKSYPTGEKHRQQPIAANGNFYAPCIDGKLAVVKTGNPLIDKWYCWGGNTARNNKSVGK